MTDSHLSQPSDPDSSPDEPSPLLEWLKNLFSSRNGESSLRESLEEVIEEHESGQAAFGLEERSMLLNTLHFSELRTDDVMLPRADILAVEAHTPLDELINTFAEASVSRMPVYRGSLDEVIAMVHIKDVFKRLIDSQKAAEATSEDQAHGVIADIQRPILFVPPSMRLPDLLVKMRSTRIHMALVVDEYGGTDGLVTIEDLVEQIVGDIEDEHDIEGAEMFRRLPDGTYEADARLPLEELEERLGQLEIDEESEEDVDSLGGLVIAIAGRVPQKGETIEDASGNSFEILDADPRRLIRLRIRPGKILTNE